MKKTYKTLLEILCSLDSIKERQDALCDGEFLSGFDVTQVEIEDLYFNAGEM